MPKKSTQIVPVENVTMPNVPKNLEVNSDKLGRPYAKIKGDNGDYYKQEKLKSNKVKRTMVTDK